MAWLDIAAVQMARQEWPHLLASNPHAFARSQSRLKHAWHLGSRRCHAHANNINEATMGWPGTPYRWQLPRANRAGDAWAATSSVHLAGDTQLASQGRRGYAIPAPCHRRTRAWPLRRRAHRLATLYFQDRSTRRRTRCATTVSSAGANRMRLTYASRPAGNGASTGSLRTE